MLFEMIGKSLAVGAMQLIEYLRTMSKKPKCYPPNRKPANKGVFLLKAQNLGNFLSTQGSRVLPTGPKNSTILSRELDKAGQ